MLTKIISGGQTGADRGALDAARDIGLERGGWAPKGWRAEDGVIPIGYREGMRECEQPGYAWRTRFNVEDSDGILVITLGRRFMSTGTRLTWDIAGDENKPRLHLQITAMEPHVAHGDARGVVDWIADHNIKTLNVAGPRESKQPGIQRATRAALVSILKEVE